MSCLNQRFFKQEKASEFFGVSKGFFNKRIRPYLTEIRWGDNPQSGVSFDVLEMHALADRIVERNGRPARKGGMETWDVKQKVSSSLQERTPLTCLPKAHSSEKELGEALERLRKKKRP